MQRFMKGNSSAKWWNRTPCSSTSHASLIIRTAVFLCLAFSGMISHAWMNQEGVPGGIVAIPLKEKSDTRPQAQFQDHPIAVVRQDNKWIAVVGLPLSLKPGTYHIISQQTSYPFNVHSKDYPEQHIKLKTRKHIDLSPEDLRRHKGEKILANAAFRHFEAQLEPDLSFIQPVQGPFTSAFGLKRFYNGAPRNPHSGLDIAAKTGEPVIAPSAGKVVLTGEFFFNGNVVYLDHGQGVVTMYCHLDEISVEEGQWLEKGQLLGKVGATGRVTGAHLHWSVSLNDSRVDPLLLLSALDKK